MADPPSGALGLLLFVGSSLFYLLAGILVLLAAALGLEVENHAVYVLWFFGFVVMLAFGVSLRIVSTVTGTAPPSMRAQLAELALLHAGTLLVTVPQLLGHHAPGSGSLVGLVSLAAAVLLHSWLLGSRAKMRDAGQPNMVFRARPRT